MTKPLRSPLLDRAGVHHAFFTREGGVSPAPWATLSFSSSTGDDPANVRENLRRAAGALGVAPGRIYYLSQVHGVAARVLDGTEDPDEVVRAMGDVALSRAAGVACGVRSADCVPILVAHVASGAVAAVHSGWRGTVQNVVRAAVAALSDLVGEPAAGSLLAAIGPHIERCCFEVDGDVAAELAACSPLGAAAVSRPAPDARPRVDLRRIVRAQLEAEGVPPGSIDDVAGCTVCDAARFHSYRRDGARSGRMLSAIVAGPTG